MTNIENFNTGIKKKGSTEVINLDPKINIVNKSLFLSSVALPIAPKFKLFAIFSAAVAIYLY